MGSAVLLVPVCSTGDDEGAGRPAAAVAVAEPFLTADEVAEIEAGLNALDATGASEQVHRLVVPSLPVASVVTVGLGKPRSSGRLTPSVAPPGWPRGRLAMPSR